MLRYSWEGVPTAHNVEFMIIMPMRMIMRMIMVTIIIMRLIMVRIMMRLILSRRSAYNVEFKMIMITPMISMARKKIKQIMKEKAVYKNV